MLLTGDTITGATAAEWGLALTAPPANRLDAAVEELADRITGVPINQLVMQKLMINQAYDNMGLSGTQIIATLFDGITRHTAEGRWFKDFSEQHGFHQAVAWRDSGRTIPDGGGAIPEPDQLVAATATHQR
jgi:enoyl-CoA hydratase